MFELIDEEPDQSRTTPDAQVLRKRRGPVWNWTMWTFPIRQEQPLIEDFNLQVQPGQRIAIVGPTGCGKTTLINLLMRFYDVDSGAIRVDGSDIRDVTRRQPAGAATAWCFRIPG